MHHGIDIAAQRVLVHRTQIARADAVWLKAADLAVAEIALRDRGVVTADALQIAALEDRAQGDLILQHLGLRQSQDRRVDIGGVAAQPRKVLTEAEQEAAARIDAAGPVVKAVAVTQARRQGGALLGLQDHRTVGRRDVQDRVL